MVLDLFDSLLQELGQQLKLSLKADKNNSCLIKMKDGVHVQLEIDPATQGFIIGTDIGPVPPGRYRENVFREALKSNGLPFPRYGILAYSRRTEQLILYERMSLKNLSGDKIAETLAPFLVKAKMWKEALSRGELPVVQAFGAGTGGTGMFGLK